MQHLANIMILVLLVFLSASTVADENSLIDKVMKLYKNHQYDEASQLIFNSPDDVKYFSSVELLQTSILLIKNLAVHKEIHQKSVTTQNIYLQLLVNDNSNARSLYAPLFLAETSIYKNQHSEAETLLNTFIQSNEISREYKDYARILYAWNKAIQNDFRALDTISKSIDQNNLLSLMAIEAIKIRLNRKKNIQPDLIKQAQSLYQINGTVISARFASLAIRIYTELGLFDQAMEILNRFPRDSATFVEQIGKDKIIRFHDVSLSESLYRFYYAYAKLLLNRVFQDKKYQDMAIFYLSELELLLANKGSAEKYQDLMKDIKRLPKNLANLVEIRGSAHGYLAGHHNRAYQTWENAVNNLKNNPFMSADAVLMCIYLDANCPTIAQNALQSAEAGRSERFEGLSLNVGRYFLINKHIAKARRLLENALDKSNSNSLAGNDPVLLINLADVYRMDKDYAESLQIFFTVAQNFPVMRQIQDAVQGEYLFEQRGAGIPVVH